MHAIPWHAGDVDAAFARARAEGKPLFLYWGAKWCPPCNQVKAEIFSKPEFIAKSSLFVPVYLDGDTERAQRLGERFGVMGYPTMLVFDAGGRELTRIPGGLDIGLYAEVLDLALAGTRPAAEALAAILAGATASADDWRLLGFYSWQQDNERALAGRDAAATLRALVTACPAAMEVACARLHGEYLAAALPAAGAVDGTTLDAAERDRALARLRRVLADHELAKANLPLVLNYAHRVLGGLTEPGSETRAALEAEWTRRLDAIAADEDVSIAERLYTSLVKLRFARLAGEDVRLPEGIADAAARHVAWADGAARTPYQRQSVINVAWYVLDQAGRPAEAEALLLAELERSYQPYYFMTDLAELAREAGRDEEAIAWYRRAYETAEGPATRFQWGYYYVDGLIALRPEDPDAIAAAATAVVAELKGQPDALYNRSSRILRRLGERLAEWNADGRYDAQVATIQREVDGLCAGLPAGAGDVATCRGFPGEG